jgi:hypothetical protein
MTDEQQIDWDRLEPGYRTGVLSLRYLAAKYKCSLGAITRRAKRDGWCHVLVEQDGTKVTRENSLKERLTEENSQSVCSLTADSENNRPTYTPSPPNWSTHRPSSDTRATSQVAVWPQVQGDALNAWSYPHSVRSSGKARQRPATATASSPPTRLGTTFRVKLKQPAKYTAGKVHKLLCTHAEGE